MAADGVVKVVAARSADDRAIAACNGVNVVWIGDNRVFPPVTEMMIDETLPPGTVEFRNAAGQALVRLVGTR
jgi:hypothetical protein